MAEQAKVLHKNIFCALAAAQSRMETLAKTALNPAFKGEGKPKGSPYADLADVVQAVKAALNQQGICFFHQIVQIETGPAMRTSLVHGETDTRIDCDVPLIVSRNDMQGMKSATTYAKRVGLESVTGIAPEDDDGNAAAAAAPRDVRNSFDPKAAAGRIGNKLNRCETLDDLRKAWQAEAETLRDIEKAAPDIYDELTRTKDARKTTLEANPPLTQDEIPY